MFFKILRKDLKESPGLNLCIFISMIVSSILVVTGAILLYATLVGFNNSYKLANSTDGFVITAKSVSNYDQKHMAMENWLAGRNEIEFFDCTDLINIRPENIYINDISITAQSFVSSTPFYISKMPDKTNLAFDMDDKPFSVQKGAIAIPQWMNTNYKIKAGDKLKLTTQVGNTYEFTVSTVYKDTSIYMFFRLLLSDNDYQKIASESPLIWNNWEIKTRSFGDSEIINELFSDLENAQGLEKLNTYYASIPFEGSKLMTSIVSIFCTAIAVFLILLVYMMLRFTLTSIIKREERSLGIFKAIGVNSLAFKLLLTAKFVFFSLISGAFAIFAGIPLANILLDSVMINIIKPSAGMETAIGIISGILFTALIILFICLLLRKINKISIINAIRGDNKSERFKKIPGLELSKCRHIKVPLFLALTDILGRFKRYIFLAFSYIFGFAIILIAFQLKDTVLSWDFLNKNQMTGPIDFYIELPQEELEKYYYKSDGTVKGVNDLISEELNKNGIPASIETACYSKGNAIIDGKEYLAGIVFGIKELNNVTFRKGSLPPQNPNEVTINYVSAKKFGFKKGDLITVKYQKADKLGYIEVTEDFIITGFTDTCSNACILVMSPDKTDFAPIQVTSVQTDSGRLVSSRLLVPEEQKSYYFEKICRLYGRENVMTGDEYLEKILVKPNEALFFSLKWILTLLVLIVMILNTALYEKVFIEEEASDIAMLKSLGFTFNKIRLWHYLRVFILVAAGFVIGALLTCLAGNVLLDFAMNIIMYASGFHLIPNVWSEYVLLPLCLIAILSFVFYLSSKNIKNIFIWRIKDE